MRVITEKDLRVKKLKNTNSQVNIRKDDFLTQSARDYIKERKLAIIYEDIKDYDSMSIETINEKAKYKYFDQDGNSYENKPEHMTQVYGNILVLKNHPRIIFRGKIDTLQAVILDAQVLAFSKNRNEIVKDLNDILNLSRNILASEVKEQPLKYELILGMDEETLRQVSHNPKKYYGVEHLVPDFRMGEVVTALNLVRTKVRETELSAINTFINANGKVDRDDIIKALNRMSSAVYIIYCKALSNR